jgi:hypothetical protein
MVSSFVFRVSSNKKEKHFFFTQLCEASCIYNIVHKIFKWVPGEPHPNMLYSYHDSKIEDNVIFLQFAGLLQFAGF